MSGTPKILRVFWTLPGASLHKTPSPPAVPPAASAPKVTLQPALLLGVLGLGVAV